MRGENVTMNVRLDKRAVCAIEELLSAGKSVEIRQRKEGIVILETSCRTKYIMRSDGNA